VNEEFGKILGLIFQRKTEGDVFFIVCLNTLFNINTLIVQDFPWPSLLK